MVSRKVVFINEKICYKYNDLNKSTSEDRIIYEKLNAAFKKLLNKPNSGEYIQKDRIPKEYVKKGINDLYKYNLTRSWRLLYRLERNENLLFIVIIDWMPHKDYEILFGYN